MTDPFEALGLDDQATPTQVRAAWRLKIALPGSHPDHGGSAQAFEELKSAYERALKIAENAPCVNCRGSGRVASGGSGFAQMLLRCMECNGSGKRN